MPFLPADKIRIPAAWETHSCCWMAWAVDREWGARAKEVTRELREIIATIAEYEPVKLLTPPDQIADAKQQSFGPNVEIIEAPVDDIWMRDIAPTFALRGDEVVAIDWNFNSWGSTSARPARPGDRLAGLMAAKLGLMLIHAPFITEGGAFVTDGDGTVVATKSCLLNENRNPAFGRTERQRMESIEQGFLTLGMRNVIWLDGDADELITSGHADGYLLFTKPGALLVEEIDPEVGAAVNRSKDIDTLRNVADSRCRLIAVSSVLPPRRRYWRFSGRSFAPSYLNAYLANGAVITGKFGDPERDEAARLVLRKSFPGRDIRMLAIDHIASGGGGVHCLTQPMPNTSLQ
jgi:agmatine deiminase